MVDKFAKDLLSAWLDLGLPLTTGAGLAAPRARWPLDMPSDDYKRRCADVLPKPREQGADCHVAGKLSPAARAARPFRPSSGPATPSSLSRRPTTFLMSWMPPKALHPLRPTARGPRSCPLAR